MRSRSDVKRAAVRTAARAAHRAVERVKSLLMLLSVHIREMAYVAIFRVFQRNRSYPLAAQALTVGNGGATGPRGPLPFGLEGAMGRYPLLPPLLPVKSLRASGLQKGQQRQRENIDLYVRARTRSRARSRVRAHKGLSFCVAFVAFSYNSISSNGLDRQQKGQQEATAVALCFSSFWSAVRSPLDREAGPAFTPASIPRARGAARDAAKARSKGLAYTADILLAVYALAALAPQSEGGQGG